MNWSVLYPFDFQKYKHIIYNVKNIIEKKIGNKNENFDCFLAIILILDMNNLIYKLNKIKIKCT
jgi:hypothetical protein